MKLRTWLWYGLAVLWLGTTLANDVVADEQQWGTLRARFVYDGVAPTPRALNLPAQLQDQTEPLVDESLLVNPHDRGIQNIVVRLVTPRASPPPIHPGYEEMAKAEAKLTVENHRIKPHIVLVGAKQLLRATNRDEFGANIIATGKQTIVKALRAHESAPIELIRSEPWPVRVYSIHPSLHGWIVVSDHPYVAKTDASGRLTISNLPVGEWTFQVWHERAGLIEHVELNGKPMTWNRGRFTVDVSDDDVFLGKILVNPIVFDDDD